MSGTPSPYEVFLADQAEAHALQREKRRRRRAFFGLALAITAVSCGIFYWLTALEAFTAVPGMIESHSPLPVPPPWICTVILGPVFGWAVFGIMAPGLNCALVEHGIGVWQRARERRRAAKNA